MAIIIGRNQLRECSALLQDEIEGRGLTLEDNPEAARAVGSQVLHTIPEIGALFGHPTRVEADMVLARTEEGGIRHFRPASFIGTLSRLRLAEIVHRDTDDALGEILIPQIDILLGFTPAIKDPDPVDMIFENTLLVPMSEIGSLGQIAS